ncbi:hyaluronan/mRNA binding family protein [Wuchereria bancrofti]|uniref:Hyaluronan/mRNA binding family protein n=1 Tax=Wuchereria bancrofti TaxID=6293 RepID=J9F8R4_WUCBA|nr:hyaluronan/mRNA binding family protein [Wuchereria bancrofti]
MVEYGVNVTNKFGFLSDDEVDDPEVIFRKAEALSKKEEKTASQKKADKNAAAKKKKEITSGAVITAVAKETEVKKQPQLPVAGMKKNDFNKENKENRPDGERGRGRGRGRGGISRGRGFVQQFDNTRPTFDQILFLYLYTIWFNHNVQNGERDVMAERFGEGRGRGRGRGNRGRPTFRGGRGGVRNFDGDQDHNMIDLQPELNGNGNVDQFGCERQNFTDFGTYRGSYRGGRGGFRGSDRDGERERPVFRGGRGGRGGRQFERMSGSDRTGIKAMDRKDGFGKGNWGTDQDEVNGQNEQMNDGTEVVMKDEDSTPREKTQEELRLEAEAEARAKQLTLDEFKAQIASKRSEPHFNIRQAGEGTNDKDFGKLVPLNKPVVEENSEEEIVVVRREPRTKRLDIEINFTDEQRGGRGGRIRDGFRGGRGSRTGRENRNPKQVQTFEVSADAFPALGSQ